MTVKQVDAILDRYRAEPWALISILQEVQEKEGHLSEGALRHVADRMGLGLPQIYGVATFYKSLHLEPQGIHEVVLCQGTACHVRGAARILDQISDLLQVGPDETTTDGLFTLRVVNCLGACAIGPIVVIDDQYHGNMTPRKASNLLLRYRSKHHGKAQERV